MPFWAVALAQDLMLHLRNAKDLHWDPYVSAGIFGIYYEEDTGESRPELAFNIGLGLIYHFNDVWAVRGDYRSAVAGADTEFNQLVTAGVDYRWGAEVKAAYNVTGGQIDSDGDGLLDSEEAQIGTDPFDPNSVLKVTTILKEGGGLRVTWSSVPGKTYTVESAVVPIGAEFLPVPGGDHLPASDGATTSFLAPAGATRAQFYRVKLEP